MPRGYVMVDARTVEGPDSVEHDVLDAIAALSWTPQLCPLMRHEYTAWGTGGPRWAWDVIATMLLKSNPDSFTAYYRGYQEPHQYWIAPDGLRYWHASFQTCRGDANDPGVRRVDQGAEPEVRIGWEGPRFAPRGIGIYERYGKLGSRPTAEVLAAGYLPCAQCARKRYDTAATVVPIDRDSIASFIASQKQSLTQRGRELDRDALTDVLKRYPEQKGGPFYRVVSAQSHEGPAASTVGQTQRLPTTDSH